VSEEQVRAGCERHYTRYGRERAWNKVEEISKPNISEKKKGYGESIWSEGK
jgi:hypothetical protein